MKKIDKNTVIADILKLPKGREILEKYQLPCLSCPMASQEIGFLKIGQVAEMYQIDIKGLLEEINKD